MELGGDALHTAADGLGVQGPVGVGDGGCCVQQGGEGGHRTGSGEASATEHQLRGGGKAAAAQVRS